MSFALPFARSSGHEGAEARVAGFGLSAIAIALFALAAFSPAVLGDGDTFSHLATGDWIIAHGAAPRADPFSHSMPGAPWTAHEWLSELLLTLAFRVGRWSGVVLMTGAAAASAALIVGLSAARELRGAPLTATVGLGLGLITASLLARPHMLALPIAAGWSAGLLAARDRARAPPLALAALMTLWANMHGGFIFGLVLIGPFALEALAEAPAGTRLATARAWTLFGLAALGAALINPYGVEALVLPFRLMGIENLSRISEWRPQDFSHPGTMELALLALIGLALTRPFSMPPIRAALMIALIAMALQHARHQTLLAILAPMLSARPIAAAIGGGRIVDERRRIAQTALTAALAAALMIGVARLMAPIERVDGGVAPISALAAVPPELRAKPVLNEYSFGGYLIWSHVRPFIDARAELYGDAMLSLYGKLQAGDPAAIEATLKRYDIAWAIFPPDARIVAILDRMPGWRRLYADAFAVVQARDAAAPEAAGLRGTEGAVWRKRRGRGRHSGSPAWRSAPTIFSR
jgi:hypothetical protein